MNNVEIMDDFERLIKEIHNTVLNSREKMIVQMAINHTCLSIGLTESGDVNES